MTRTRLTVVTLAALALLVPALAPAALATPVGAGGAGGAPAPAALRGASAPGAAPAAGPISPAALRVAVPYPNGFGTGTPERSAFSSRQVSPCTTSARTVRGSTGLARRADWTRASDGAITQTALVNVVQFTSAAAAVSAWNAQRAAMTTGCQGVRTLSTLDWVGRGKVTVSATKGYAGRAGVQQRASWKVLAMEGPGTEVMGEVVLQQLVGPAWVQVISRDMLRYSPSAAQVARATALMATTTQRYATALAASRTAVSRAAATRTVAVPTLRPAAVGGPLATSAAVKATIPYPNSYAAGSPDRIATTTKYLQPCVIRNGGDVGTRVGFVRVARWEGAGFAPAPVVSYSIVQFASRAAAAAAWNARKPGMTTGCKGTRKVNLDAIGGVATVTVSALTARYGFTGVRQNARWNVAYAEGYTPGPHQADLVLQRLVGSGWLTVTVKDATRSTLSSATVSRALADLTTMSNRYAAAVGL